MSTRTSTWMNFTFLKKDSNKYYKNSHTHSCTKVLIHILLQLVKWIYLRSNNNKYISILITENLCTSFKTVNCGGVSYRSLVKIVLLQGIEGGPKYVFVVGQNKIWWAKMKSKTYSGMFTYLAYFSSNRIV